MNVRLLKVTIVQSVSFCVLLVVALVAYASYAERRGEEMAHKFCDARKICDAASQLFEAATDAGADVRQTKWRKVQLDGDLLSVTFSGALPLSRHICSIRSAEGKIIEARYVYLD